MDKRAPEERDQAIDQETSSRPGAITAGVRRVNNVPLLIIGCVLLVFVILVSLVITRRDEPAATSLGEPQAALPESSKVLDQLAGGITAGVIASDEEPPAPAIPVARLTEADLPPLPPRFEATVPDDGQLAERMKLLQSALHAKTSIARTQASDTTSREPSPNDDDATAPAAAPPAPAKAPEAKRDAYAGFDRKGGKGDRWSLDTTTEAPRSVYELRAGTVIPAVMISGIDSELPGQIIAQVSQDVFDTATGRFRLVPQGSRLIGSYDSETTYGQSRLLVAWQRIVFPDGKALDIGAMAGVDASGYTGFHDRVNRHYLRVFGSAILLSGITAGLTSSRVDPSNDPFGSSNSAVLSQALAQQIGTVATEMIRKNMDVAPSLRIRPGYRFHVMAVKDLTFETPYTAFDY